MSGARGRWSVLGVLCLALVVISLDLTVLNVALPTISASLGASTAGLQWITDAYSLVFAGVMLPAGALGDRWGRKRMLLTGLMVFLAASLWCAFAGSTPSLIAARAVMGLGAAIVMPLTLGVVSASFDDNDRPKALAAATASVAVGLPLGPIIAGVLLQHFYWGSVFLINVPVIVATLIAGGVMLDESRASATSPLDITGTVLGVGGVLALVFGVIRGPEHGWTNAVTLVMFAAALILFGAFAYQQRRSPHPVVDRRLFTDSRFSWGTLATVAVSVALFGIMFVLPQYLQGVRGNDTFGTGLRLIPLMIGLLTAGAGAGQLNHRVGSRVTVAAGLVALTAGLLVLAAVGAHSSYWVVAVGLVLCGVGVGAAIASAMDGVMAAVGGDEAGAGAAMNSTLRQIGGALAVAALGSLLSSAYQHSLHLHLPGLPHPVQSAAMASIELAHEAASRLGRRGSDLQDAAGVAFSHGMSLVMLACAVVTAITVPLALWRLPRHRRHQSQAGEREPVESKAADNWSGER